MYISLDYPARRYGLALTDVAVHKAGVSITKGKRQAFLCGDPAECRELAYALLLVAERKERSTTTGD